MARLTAAVVAAAAAVAALAGCGGDEPDRGGEGPRPVADAGPIHVHGLGVNPRDGALFIATHTGLFRAAPGESRARRVGGRMQDTMGFTVVGPDHFLGSGHPDLREDLPPFLGLIASRDAGRTWQPVSLLGRADFHVLEARGRVVYGFGADYRTRRGRFLASSDGGRRWQERPVPEPLVSLALDPRDPRRLVAAGERGLHASADGGRRWRSLPGVPGLLTWPAPERLYRARADGVIDVSGDGGRSWRSAGQAGGEIAALDAPGAAELYVALHDGTVKRSTDGGRSWTVRSRP